MVLGRVAEWSRWRKVLTFGALGVVVAVGVALLLYFLVWAGDAPPPPDVLARSEAVTATSAAPAPTPAAPSPAPAGPQPPPVAAEPAAPSPAPAGPPPVPEPSPGPYPDAGEGVAEPPPPAVEPPPPPEPSAPPDPPAAEEPAAGVSLEGVWTVDTTLGSFEDYTASWAGYRVGEELSGIGTVDAVGRTPAVSGSLEIAGTSLVSAAVEVDLTTLTSDRPQRDGRVQGALETGVFPTARFELTEPVDFGPLPNTGDEVTAVVAGTFEAHGVMQPVQIDLAAVWMGDIIFVGGTFEIRFADYGITAPSAPIVLSVEETALVELLLNFTR